MSRIAFAQGDPGNLRKLQTRIIGLLNQHVEQVTRDSGVLAKWIYKVVVVGNTCMHHLLLGIDPWYVWLAPYAPVLRHAVTVSARELFLKVNPEARVCLLPLVAGFVGADAVAVALATRIADTPEIRIAVDIGNMARCGSARGDMWADRRAGPTPRVEVRADRQGCARRWRHRSPASSRRLPLHTIGEAAAQGVCGGHRDAIPQCSTRASEWTGS